MGIKHAYIQLALLAIFLLVVMAFHLHVIAKFGVNTVRIVLVFTTFLCMVACAALYGYVRRNEKKMK